VRGVALAGSVAVRIESVTDPSSYKDMQGEPVATIANAYCRDHDLGRGPAAANARLLLSFALRTLPLIPGSCDS